MVILGELTAGKAASPPYYVKFLIKEGKIFEISRRLHWRTAEASSIMGGDEKLKGVEEEKKLASTTLSALELRPKPRMGAIFSGKGGLARSSSHGVQPSKMSYLKQDTLLRSHSLSEKLSV